MTKQTLTAGRQAVFSGMPEYQAQAGKTGIEKTVARLLSLTLISALGSLELRGRVLIKSRMASATSSGSALALRTQVGHRPRSAKCQSATISLGSFDHFISKCEQLIRDVETERFCSLEVDKKIEFYGLLDWKIAGLGTL